jgi:1-acyl-sn-glycerol-3-phosphate acyltransferase
MTNANCGSRRNGSAAQSIRLPAWARIVFGIYAWLEFTIIALLGLPVLLLLPGLTRRRRFVSALARAALWLAGIRVVLHGSEPLPAPCILVANHCSYIDGVVLTAALPPMFSFVIKREMSRFPLAGTLLRRIGSEFVDRTDRRMGSRDTRRLLRNAASGHALAFFPEGTFSEDIGLARFHIGAFAAAARSGMPVVPVAIRGSRFCLPAGGVWPNPGRIHVEILSLLPVSADSPSAGGDLALQLRDRARAQILQAIDEPDLAAMQK